MHNTKGKNEKSSTRNPTKVINEDENELKSNDEEEDVATRSLRRALNDEALVMIDICGGTQTMVESVRREHVD